MDDLAEIERMSADEIKEGLLEWLTVLNKDEHYQRKSLVYKSTYDSRNLLNGRCAKWNQFGRRNISPYVRAELALRLEEVIKVRARANLRLADGGDRKSENIKNQGCPKSDKVENPVNTNKELAKIAGVGHDTIHKVEVIENDDTEEGKNGDEMKSNKIVNINNRYKNKGITFLDDMTFSDLLQAWCYLSRYMFDLTENKTSCHSMFQDRKSNLKCRAEFRAFLKYWHEYAEKTIPDDVKITIKEVEGNEK